jgi:hypothetical protein
MHVDLIHNQVCILPLCIECTALAFKLPLFYYQWRPLFLNVNGPERTVSHSFRSALILTTIRIWISSLRSTDLSLPRNSSAHVLRSALVTIYDVWFGTVIYWTLDHLQITVNKHAHVHTIVSTVTPSFPLFGIAFQRLTSPFLWFSGLFPAT